MTVSLKSVLLAGCGNIGFRHLQAMCAMEVPARIVVVEPNREHHPRILTQFADAGSSDHIFELSPTLPADGRAFDLAVVATTAMHRRAVVEGILAEHRVDTMILEKVLFQTTDDLDAVAALLAEHGVTASVNCGRRTFPGYRSLRDRFEGDGPVHITVSGQRLGLASNAIHFLDLAEFLNDSEIAAVDHAGLEPGSLPARHPDCVEIFGTLSGTLANGARVSIVSLDVDPVQVVVTVTSTATTATIDELARTVVVNDLDAVPFESQHVSETSHIYEEALLGDAGSLTPFADSVRQHRAYLEALREHLGLPQSTSQAVPVS